MALDESNCFNLNVFKPLKTFSPRINNLSIFLVQPYMDAQGWKPLKFILIFEYEFSEFVYGNQIPTLQNHTILGFFLILKSLEWSTTKIICHLPRKLPTTRVRSLSEQCIIFHIKLFDLYTGYLDVAGGGGGSLLDSNTACSQAVLGNKVYLQALPGFRLLALLWNQACTYLWSQQRRRPRNAVEEIP